MTTFKTHIALTVSDLERSIAFYQAVFGARPVKHKANYAKFDLENPGLNLTLNVSDRPSAGGMLSHLGIQVDSAVAVGAAIARLKAAHLPAAEEFNTDCCYALQDKVWTSDPDGNRWEIFFVRIADTAPELEVDAVAKSPEAATARACCAPTCCV